jgi:hypothetical protein
MAISCHDVGKIWHDDALAALQGKSMARAWQGHGKDMATRSAHVKTRSGTRYGGMAAMRPLASDLGGLGAAAVRGGGPMQCSVVHMFHLAGVPLLRCGAPCNAVSYVCFTLPHSLRAPQCHAMSCCTRQQGVCFGAIRSQHLKTRRSLSGIQLSGRRSGRLPMRTSRSQAPAAKSLCPRLRRHRRELGQLGHRALVAGASGCVK